MTQTYETGRSMLEMLAVIAIISVITVGGASALSYQLNLFRASTVQSEVQGIIRGVTDLYTWNRDFTKLDMDTICENDILQKTCFSDSNSNTSDDTSSGDTNGESNLGKFWYNAFGGTIRVKAASLTYGIYTDEKSSNNKTDIYRPDRNDTGVQSSFTVTYTRIPKQVCEQFVCYTQWSDARIISHSNTSSTDCLSGCDNENTMIFAPKTF